jgi:hypothetical protein
MVIQPEPTTAQLPFESPVLFSEERNHIALFSLKPAEQSRDDQVQRKHAPSLRQWWQLPSGPPIGLDGVLRHLGRRSSSVSRSRRGCELRGEHDSLKHVVNDRLLLPIGPAGEQQEEEDERGRQRGHGGSLPEARPRFQRARDWDTLRSQPGLTGSRRSLLRQFR